MASIAIKQLPHTLKKDGTCQVYIRITHGRKPNYIPSGVSVKPSQFNEGMGNWISKHPDSILLNAQIEAKRSKIAAAISKAAIEDVEIDIESIVKGRASVGNSFFNAITATLDSYEATNKVAVYNHLHTNFRFLKEAWGKDISIGAIKRKDVEKFVSYRFAKGNGISTVKKALQGLSVVLSNAGYNGDDMFAEYRKGMIAIPVQREKLTFEEIKKFEEIKLSGVNELARDMFLFSYYCQGMRFENVATLNRENLNGDVLTYRMNKGKKIREISIHPKLRVMLDKYIPQNNLYIFPAVKVKIESVWKKKEIIGSANALMNTYIRRVAILCGVEKKLSFHIARHSAANNAYQKGVRTDAIKEILGHSNLRTTESYISSLNNDKINEAFNKIYE